MLPQPKFTNAEFRRHQKIDNPLHIIGFLSQWKLYLDQLPEDPSQEFKGRKLDPTVVEKVWSHLRHPLRDSGLILF